MSLRMVKGFNVLLSILIIFYFAIGSCTVLSATEQTPNNTGTSLPTLNITKQEAASESRSTTGHDTCENLGHVHSFGPTTYYNWKIDYVYAYDWHNTSFWGGHIQIPWRGNVEESCSKRTDTYLVTLKEKHMAVSDIRDHVITVAVCLWNYTDECIGNFKVEMINCNGHLLYRIPREDNSVININVDDIYVCFDRIYSDTCQSNDFVYTAGKLTDKFLNLSKGDLQSGWLNAHQNGKQYFLPSYDDVDGVIEECLDLNEDSFFLKERMPSNIPEDIPIKLNLCPVINYEYYDYVIADDLCFFYVYARICNGGIQFDVSFFTLIDKMCLVSCNENKDGLSTTALIGIILGSVLMLVLVTGVVVYVRYYRRRLS